MKLPIIILLFFLLLILGARAHPLWGDEAETALFARNILKYGLPRGFDGTNLMGHENAVALNGNLINYSNPWTQYYLTAFSFKIFGESSFSARLPFILISLFSIPTIYLIILKLFKLDSLSKAEDNNFGDRTKSPSNRVILGSDTMPKRTGINYDCECRKNSVIETLRSIIRPEHFAFLSSLALSLSVPFILWSFQARYYPLTVFAGLSMAFSSLSFSEGKKYKILFFLSCVFFLYSHYVSFTVFYLALFVAGLVYYRLRTIECCHSGERQRLQNLILVARSACQNDEGRIFILNYLLLGLLAFITYLPFLLIFQPLGRAGFSLPNIQSVYSYAFPFLISLYHDFNISNALPVLFLPLLFWAVIKYRHSQSLAPLVFLASLNLSYFLLITLATLLTMEKADNLLIFLRYNTVLFPYLIALSVLTLNILFAKHQKILIIVFLLFLFSNIFTLNPPRLFLLEFAKEVLHPYPSPDWEVAQYLKVHVQGGDLAFVSLDRAHDPLMFYLGDKVRFVNRVLPTNPRLFPQNYSRLPKYLYSFKEKPDWIILYGRKEGLDPFDYGSYDWRDWRQFPGIDLRKDYEETVLPVYFLDASRPEITYHSFTPVKPNEGEKIYIYKKSI